MSTKSKYFGKKEFNCGNSPLPCMTEDLNEVESFVQEELGVTSESEEFFEEPYETPKSSSSSVRIKPGKHVSISDIDSPQEDQKVEKTKERKPEQNPMSEVATSNISQSFSLEQDSEAHSNVEISVSHGQPSLTGGSSISSVVSKTSIRAKKQDIKKEVPAEEKLNTSETVRQMLQDEMFKLVQLQQINFMSLMQIVQSSFANLPNVQEILQQYQSVHLEGSQPVHSAKGGDCQSSCCANASLKIELPTQEDKGKSDEKSSDFQPRNSLRDESNNGHIQNHLDVNVSLSLLQSRSRETGFMPPSQDLHSSAPVKVHLLAPSSDVQKTPKFIPIEKTLNYSNGFPLLKLKSGYHFKPAFLYPIEMSSAFARPPPIPRVAWNSSDSLWNHQSSYTPRKNKSTAHLNTSRCDPESPRQIHEEQKRWAETVHKQPPKHLNGNQYEEQEVSSQQQFAGNVKMDNTLITQNLTGIPLLHLQLDPVPRLPPVIRQPITTALVPVKPVTRETEECRETLQHTGISLLRANLPPKKKVPKLIPLQDLIAFEQRHHYHTVANISFGQDQTEPIQLLKTDIEPFEPREVQNSRKRQKRRDEKQMKEKEEKKKPIVSFHPEDSIISISDTMTVVESETGAQEAESTSYLRDDFFISVDKVGEAITTPTDLHYMASTRKKTAETQDASTNTHPVLKSYKDVGISARTEVSEVQKNESVVSVSMSESSSVPELLPPDMHLNLRFPSEVKESPLPSFLSDAPDLSEHEYINVTDIENTDILNDLPMIPESAEEIATTEQNEKFEIPSTAELHHIAASVTNAIPPELLQRKDKYLKDVSNQVQKEDKKPDSARDSVTWNMVHEDARTSPSSGLLSKVISKEYVSTKQQEMDMQLRLLQNITENMEEDFRNTKLLVKIIEDFEMASNSDLGARPSFSEDARIVGDEHYLRAMIFEDVVDDEKESLKLEHPVPSYTTLEVHSTASASNFPSGIKSSSGFHISGELCDSSLENPLQITGLSGVTDIISDLVVEGDISPMELGFMKAQAKKISRLHDSASGHSQKTEKEKKEIQAWMKRKQKERMREYVKKLDEQRQKEHNPFNLRKNMHCRLTSKDIKLFKKKKEEKDKVLLSEHHSRRVSEALSLMNEMLSETVVLPANEHRPLSRTRSPQEYRKQHIVSTKGGHPDSRVLSERSRTAAKPSFGQKQHHFTPSLRLTQSRGSASVLLQKSTVTGRMRNAANSPVNSRSSAEYRVSRTSKQKLPHVATAVQTAGLDHETDRDAGSPWTVPDDIQRILQDTHDTLFQGSALHTVSFSPVGINNTDGISESTESVLSKLDWNAIEAMVADVEDT